MNVRMCRKAPRQKTSESIAFASPRGTLRGTRGYLRVAVATALVTLTALWLPLLSRQAAACPSGQCCVCGENQEGKVCRDKEGGNSVDSLTGGALFDLDHPLKGVWQLRLNYSSEESRWTITNDMRLAAMGTGTTHVRFYPDASTEMTFKRADTQSPWIAYNWSDNAIRARYRLEAADPLTEDMKIYDDGSHGKTVYAFHPFNSEDEYPNGRIKSVAVGQREVTFAYDDNELATRPSSMVDEFGRTLYFEYTANGAVQKIIEPNPAYAAGPLNNKHGRVTWIEYASTNMTLMAIGMPKRPNANAGPEGEEPTVEDYYWRKTALVYWVVGKLSHVIRPEHYDAWEASTDPDKDDKYATTKFAYYTMVDAPPWSGRVGRETVAGCEACGGGSSFGLEYMYASEVPSIPVSFVDLSPDDGQTESQNTVTNALYQFRWEDGMRRLRKIVQMNADGQVLYDLERATDGTGHLKRYLYTAERHQLDNMTEYSVTFDFADFNPFVAGTEASDFAPIGGMKNEYDAQYRRSAKKVWDGSSYLTHTEWAYVDDCSSVVDNETVYDGTNAFNTKYFYDGDCQLVCTAYPEVTQNTPDGDNYTVGRRTYYEAAHGRVAEVRMVKLSADPDQWDNDAADLDNLTSTHYLYADNDGLDNDGDDLIDGADGNGEGFELTRVIVDNATLKLETRYGYTPVCGIWRRTAEIVDPPNPDNEAEKHLNLVTTYDYTSVNRSAGAWGDPTTIVEPESAYRTVLDYDKAGRVTSRTRSVSGAVLSATTYRYCKYGKTCSTTEAAGFPEETSTVTEWDEVGRTLNVYTGVKNLRWENGSWSGQVKGNVTSYTYVPGTDRVLTVKQRAGWATTPVGIASYTYTVDGRQKTVTNALGNATTYDYDKLGNLDNVTNALGELTRYSYDRQGKLLTTTVYEDDDVEKNPYAKTGSLYDAMDRAYRSIVYNPDNESCTIETNFYHDGLGNVVKLEDPDGDNTTYAYDKASRRISTEDALGNGTYSTYDPAGRVTVQETKHVAGLTSVRRELTISYYDANGRLTDAAFWGTNAPDGWSWAVEPVPWDFDNIPAEAGYSDDSRLVTSYAYGCDVLYGPFTYVADPKGIESYTYTDRLGRTARTLESADGVDRVTLYAYDQAMTGVPYVEDTITARNDPSADQVTRYVRSDAADAGRVTQTVYPDAGSVYVEYDADGTAANRTDQRRWKTTYTRDALGRVTREEVEALANADPETVTGTTLVTRTYDALGRLTQITDNMGYESDNAVGVHWTYAWSADSAEQTVTEKLYFIGSLMGSVTSVVNEESERIGLTYPNSRQLTLTHDALGRADSISDSGGTIAHYDYKGGYLNWRNTHTSANAFRMTFDNGTELGGYDAFGRVVWMKHYRPDGGGIPAEDNIELTYGYDDASNPTYREDVLLDDSDELYAYDALHRLVSFERGDLTDSKTAIENVTRTQTWTLDKLGNWVEFDDDGTEHDRLFGPANENVVPCTAPGYAHEVDGEAREVMHDAAGNLLLYEIDDGTKTYRYTYDYRNRLIKVESKTTGSYSTVVQYLYDGLNRRVKKDLTSGTDIVYLYDGSRVLEERIWIEAGAYWAPRRQYVYGDRFIDERLTLDLNATPGQDNECESRYRYHEDRNWNVAQVTGQGVWEAKFNYTPYGEYTKIAERSGGSYGATGNPYFFQERYWDADAELYYFRNRWYHPKLGRFLQRDPWGYFDGMNLNEFGASHPTLATDPYGLRVEPLTREEAEQITRHYAGYGAEAAKEIVEAEYDEYRQRHWVSQLRRGPCIVEEGDTCCTTVRRWDGYASFESCMNNTKASTLVAVVGAAATAAGVALEAAKEHPGSILATMAAVPVVAKGLAVAGTAVLSTAAGRGLAAKYICSREHCVGVCSPSRLEEPETINGVTGCWKCPKWVYEKPYK